MSRYGYGYGEWDPYVPVAERKRLATQEAKRRLKKGHALAPIVRITARKIASTFWGIAWCDNLEHYSDIANRLPRGKTYARNGSIVDLKISKGKIKALVAGSSPYDVQITIKKLDSRRWSQLRKDCEKSIHSLIDLMCGKLPDDVMHRLTMPGKGLFPEPKEINLSCSCPDGAQLCKHLAAVLYGIGHRLDSEPDLFFILRGVDQHDLISDALTTESVDIALGLDQESAINADELESIFGIDLANTDVATKPKPKPKQRSPKQGSTEKTKKVTATKVTKKKTAKKKTSKKAATKKKAVKKATKTPKTTKSRKHVRAAKKSPSNKTRRTKKASAK